MLSDKCTWPWGHWVLFGLGKAPTPRLAVIMVKREAAPIDNRRSLRRKESLGRALKKRDLDGGGLRLGCLENERP
ncbi:hypothetical protein TNCV_1605201 [Trichonephila clavipes]|nr:hypothetical protein TNCV_1605201 [Trichonephila clavipes]